MTSIFYESLASLIEPIGLLWAALLVIAVWQACRRRRGQAVLAALLALFIHLIGGTNLPAWLLARLERPYDPLVRGWPTQADAVVMLGGTHAFTQRSPLHFGVGEASDRILAAVELARTTHARALVLGGSKYEERGQLRPDSELLTAWFRAWNVPTGEIHLLGICADTHDEAVRAVQLARAQHWQRIVVVTSGYHLRRAEATFRKLGLEIIPAGAEFLGLDSDGAFQFLPVPRLRGFELMKFWVHEQIGWFYYRWKGWV
ncbi:MAG TPA: YdcF family protein [Candidatus Limnocylindria bacterium]|jgi:uncharacterized SAM-binding protein YcdF (DUF218 family)|nr:YdcF family protein [Candidatus Limnocylindria bacterium]